MTIVEMGVQTWVWKSQSNFGLHFQLKMTSGNSKIISARPSAEGGFQPSVGSNEYSPEMKHTQMLKPKTVCLGEGNRA
jgi:hypothetical protein